MLVLRRNMYESVVIEVGGKLIVVTVVEVRKGYVRLGFKAGKEVVIHRKEVWEKINGPLKEKES